MRNKKWITGIAAAGVALVLGACGNGGETAGSGSDEQVLRVGASNVPHAEILELVAPKLEEDGITLEIETYNDYVIPNVALDEGDIDANYFQTIPYFESEMEENGYDFVNMGSIHIEPLGAYSQDYASLDELPEGARVLVPNSITDHARVVTILEAAGLVTLEEGVEKTQASFDDIVENPRNLQFEYDYDPALMPTMYEQGEGDAVFINSNFAVDNGLNPVEDAIALEDPTSPYANIVAARSEDAENEAIQRLVEELQTPETQEFILETWGGAVIPVTE
ncbi:MetQ/NlpA family ABC transporter substrate-binding protein [Atopococcus tabaci]|uniref:MetQ/NlpA family ABC transporter substrate-binding protein n=1 Tax=Atopococcus tabaci TaxID=269774 RepID=UPI00042560CE|nr:MetQ/NlpA family ABC transporter substrate-binding protein [Atopococcus tabaci]